MGTEISDGGFNPVGKRDGEKMSQQVFVGGHHGKKFVVGTGMGS
jgi:hypothetical protein